MSDYNENRDIFLETENIKTNSTELLPEKELHEIEIDELKYGINKPIRVEIEAKIIHGKGKKKIYNKNKAR